MAFLKTPRQINNYNYGRKHLWDIRFINLTGKEKLPDRYTDFYPAISINMELDSISSNSFTTILGNISIPTKLNLDRVFTMSFYDDEEGYLLAWFYDWTQYMFFKVNNRYHGVAPLDFCCRNVEIINLNSNREKLLKGIGLLEKKLWIYPTDNTIAYAGESDNGLQQYDMHFKIAGFA